MVASRATAHGMDRRWDDGRQQQRQGAVGRENNDERQRQLVFRGSVMFGFQPKFAVTEP
jgi:hypothetical protein